MSASLASVPSSDEPTVETTEIHGPGVFRKVGHKVASTFDQRAHLSVTVPYPHRPSLPHYRVVKVTKPGAAKS